MSDINLTGCCRARIYAARCCHSKNAHNAAIVWNSSQGPEQGLKTDMIRSQRVGNHGRPAHPIAAVWRAFVISPRLLFMGFRNFIYCPGSEARHQSILHGFAHKKTETGVGSGQHHRCGRSTAAAWRDVIGTHNQPPSNPARRKPSTMYAHFRISCHNKPVR